MAKRKKEEQMRRAQSNVQLPMRTYVKKRPDQYDAVQVTAENATKVIEWVAFLTEGKYQVRADFGDWVVHRIWDDAIEVWDNQAFLEQFYDTTNEKE